MIQYIEMDFAIHMAIAKICELSLCTLRIFYKVALSVIHMVVLQGGPFRGSHVLGIPSPCVYSCVKWCFFY